MPWIHRSAAGRGCPPRSADHCRFLRARESAVRLVSIGVRIALIRPDWQAVRKGRQKIISEADLRYKIANTAPAKMKPLGRSGTPASGFFDMPPGSINGWDRATEFDVAGE